VALLGRVGKRPKAAGRAFKIRSKNSALRTKITQAKIRSIERGYEKEKNKDLTRNKEQLEKENKKLEALLNTILKG
jgi:hypothetical protein